MVRSILIYADGADHASMAKLAKRSDIYGFTTNPSLMRKVGVSDYPGFAREVLAVVNGKSVSFEVFADDLAGMERQAREIANWGANVYVKIPITNTLGKTTCHLIEKLSSDGVKLNVTAIFTKDQARAAVDAIGNHAGIVSIFAGRIADTGRDPTRIMRSVRAKIGALPVKVLWASAREVYNVVQAEECGCDIITLPPDLIAKLDGFGRDLVDYSLDTVKQFKRDAEGLTL